ncbi:hypothetical protein E4U41_007806 [Claviceps citrina]|nr:hypothetical protein E4U41_007806 [Claviceps citrina]
MHSLWARAGEARCCGCRGGTAVGSIRRRGAGVARRRKPTFAELFTACYSSVFATAAVVDAIGKDAKRNELDRKLEEARRELSELKERSSKTTRFGTTSKELGSDQMDAVWRALKKIYWDRPYMKEIHDPATLPPSELISSLKSEFYNAVGEPALVEMRKTNYERLEGDIAAEQLDGQFLLREPRNATQLLHDTESTKHLVRVLIRRAEYVDRGRTQSAVFDEAKHMANERCPDFSFPSIDPERAAKTSSSLNSLIRTLISAHHLGFKEKIGRICYNLLVAPYTPDIHTYNTLIVAFTKSGYHFLSDALVFSFFHERLLKPTPTTYAAVLNHYKSTNNHGQFLRTIACLAGLDTWTGAKMARRHVNDVALTPSLQSWAADTQRRTQSGQFFYEHGPLSTTVIEMALQGLLHFKLFADAATLFLDCLRSRVALSVKSITHLFDECLAALDWKAAVRLVRGLMRSRREWERLLSQIDEASTGYLLSRASALTDLCGVGNSVQEPGLERLARLFVSPPRRKGFLELLATSKPRFPDKESAGFLQPVDGACGKLLQSKRRLLQIESLWKEYEHARKTTDSIKSKLLYPCFPLSFRITMAFYIGDYAIRRSLDLSHEVEQILSAIEVIPHQPRASSLAKEEHVEHHPPTQEVDRLSVDAMPSDFQLEASPQEGQ